MYEAPEGAPPLSHIMDAGMQEPDTDGIPADARVVEIFLGPPSKPEDYLLEAAEKWVAEYLRTAVDYVNKKKPVWDRLKYMYMNELKLSEWDEFSKQELDTYQGRATDSSKEEELNTRTDEIISIHEIVNTWVEGAFSMIFESDPWFSVIPEEDIATPSIEDPEYSTAEKLEKYVDRELKAARSKEPTYKALRDMGLFGSGALKIGWFEKKVPLWFTERYVLPDGTPVPLKKGQKPKPKRKEQVVESRPKLDVIPPDCFLPDPNATSSNVQEWYGVGHKTVITRAEAEQLYKDKVFTLNRDEFEQMWEPAESASKGFNPAPTHLMEDSDKEGVDNKIDSLMLWEYHGLIPTEKGDIESVCTILTDEDAEYPTSGFIARLHEGTVLQNGKRPFVFAVHTPWEGPYGVGAVQPQFDIIYLLSMLRNLLVDNIRFSVNAQIIVRPGSQAHRQLQKDRRGPESFPGKVWTCDPDDVKPFEMPRVDINALVTKIQLLTNELKMRTGVDESARGVEGRGKTASEVHALQEKQQTPLSVRLSLISESFVDPMLELVLATTQQYEIKDQSITTKDSQGNVVYMKLSRQEITTGKYSIQSALSRQDTQRIAYLQSIERAIPLLLQVMPMINQEGQKLFITAIVKEWLRRLRMPRVDQTIQPLTPDEIQQMQQQAMMEQQMAAGGGQGGQPGMTQGVPGPNGGPMPAMPNDPTGQMIGGAMGTNDPAMMEAIIQEAARMNEGQSFQG